MGIHFIRHYKRYMDTHCPKLYSGGLSVLALFIYNKRFPDFINDLLVAVLIVLKLKFYKSTCTAVKRCCKYSLYILNFDKPTQSEKNITEKSNQLTQKLKCNFPSVMFTPKALKIKFRRLFPFL